MTGTPAKEHKVAFYADTFYDSEHSPAYWIPPANLDVDVILLGGDIHYSPDGIGAMLAEIRQSQDEATRIVVVPGNGEYAGQELDESRDRYRAHDAPGDDRGDPGRVEPTGRGRARARQPRVRGVFRARAVTSARRSPSAGSRLRREPAG